MGKRKPQAMAYRLLAALATVSLFLLVSIHADTVFFSEPQEVSADEMLLLGSSNTDAKLAPEDRKAIKKVYNEAGQKQHARDLEQLRRLEQQPEKHRCWCSLAKHIKSKAELGEENEQENLDALQLKVSQAKHEADEMDQVLKSQQETKQEESTNQAPSVGDNCWKCQQKKLKMQLQLRALQMEAGQLAQEVKSMRQSV